MTDNERICPNCKQPGLCQCTVAEIIAAFDRNCFLSLTQRLMRPTKKEHISPATRDDLKPRRP